jgi:hypothetical protein
MRFPVFALKLQNDDLHRLHTFFVNRLASSPNCTVIPAGDLMAQKRNASATEILAAYSTWGTIHGTNSSYTRMAFFLMDNLLASPKATKPRQHSGSVKRPRSESTSSSNRGRDPSKQGPSGASRNHDKQRRDP